MAGSGISFKVVKNVFYIVVAALVAAYVINWFITQYSEPRVVLEDNQFGGLIAPQMDEMQTAGPFQNPNGCAGCPVAGSTVLAGDADQDWTGQYVGVV